MSLTSNKQNNDGFLISFCEKNYIITIRLFFFFFFFWHNRRYFSGVCPWGKYMLLSIESWGWWLYGEVDCWCGADCFKETNHVYVCGVEEANQPSLVMIKVLDVYHFLMKWSKLSLFLRSCLLLFFLLFFNISATSWFEVLNWNKFCSRLPIKCFTKCFNFLFF